VLILGDTAAMLDGVELCTELIRSQAAGARACKFGVN
jgi:hypothetical protein